MKVKNLYSSLIVLSLIATSSFSNSETSTPTQRLVETNAVPNVGINKMGKIYYIGPINYKGYELLQKLYINSKKKITSKTLIIESGGGNPFVGLLIGNFIKDKKMSVQIPSFCLSTCANYIFPAANYKYLGKNGIIGFHEATLAGSNKTIEEVITKMKETAPDNLKVNITIKTEPRYIPDECKFHSEFVNSQVKNNKMFQNMIESCNNYLNSQTKSFYKKLNINSKFSDMGIPKYRQAKKSNDEIILFYYDSESLKALGVNKVIYPYNWTPKNYLKHGKMVEVKLSDWQ